MTKSVAIIFHENERKIGIRRYTIWHLAEYWKKDGIRVLFLFGVKRQIPADVAILHVDLSMVPDKYIEFAQRYPVALNDQVKDIRKSSFCGHKVHLDDGYDGKVIVKSELNYAGGPERKLLGTPLSRLAMRIGSRLPRFQTAIKGDGPTFRTPYDYLIFDSPNSVPREWFHKDDLIIEKFLSEKQDGLYCLRSHHFLGGRSTCVLRKSPHPIVNTETAVSRDLIEPDPRIVELTKAMKFDFGKFDYLMQEGVPFLIDVNKTIGAGNSSTFFAMCRELAKGIHSYF